MVYRGIHYFSYFCSKPRLWVLVRTASSSFLVVKFSIYLNMRVFVMKSGNIQCNIFGSSMRKKTFLFFNRLSQVFTKMLNLIGSLLFNKFSLDIFISDNICTLMQTNRVNIIHKRIRTKAIA